MTHKYDNHMTILRQIVEQVATWRQRMSSQTYTSSLQTECVPPHVHFVHDLGIRSAPHRYKHYPRRINQRNQS